MKLTKQECKIILKAVELIDEDKYVYACSALHVCQGMVYISDYGSLVYRFADFYGFEPGDFWPFDDFRGLKEWRMNNLLLFMYAESEGEG